jgi:hypothetical protein
LFGSTKKSFLYRPIKAAITYAYIRICERTAGPRLGAVVRTVTLITGWDSLGNGTALQLPAVNDLA